MGAAFLADQFAGANVRDALDFMTTGENALDAFDFMTTGTQHGIEHKIPAQKRLHEDS